MIFNSLPMASKKMKCVLNDCIADPEGRLFTGSCFFDSNNDKYRDGCLFRVDRDGSLHLLTKGFVWQTAWPFRPIARPCTSRIPLNG
jgi:sugar lactone lactonase YvrE